MLTALVNGIGRTENRAVCITCSVLIHYFTLAAWMWMGAEALVMFKKLVIVFGKMSVRFILFVSLVCWGNHTRTQTCKCMHTYKHSHAHTKEYTYTYTHKHTRIHTHMDTCTSIHTYMYTNITMLFYRCHCHSQQM